MALYSELKRRNVFKVGVLYAVATWLVLQVVDRGVSFLGLPEWAGNFVLLLLALGFPVALIFSWVYEITPEGLKKEIDVDQTQSIVYKTGQKLNAAVAVLLVLGLAALVGGRLLPDSAPARIESAEPEVSIAVLPFDDMSPADKHQDIPTAKRYDAVAFDLYLQAGPLWMAEAEEPKRRALALLGGAVELDSDLGPAWVLLAYAHMNLATAGQADSAASYKMARSALLRAALLGEAGAIVGLGWVAIAGREDMRDGFDYFRIGNELAGPDDWIVISSTSLMCRYLGAPGQGAAALNSVVRRSQIAIDASAHARSGDIDTAFKLLEGAVDVPNMVSLRVDASTRFANLVGHPRWDALLLRHGLHDSQRPSGLCGFP